MTTETATTTELEKRLREGVRVVPTNEFENDLYDIDAAETAMAEAADRIASLEAELVHEREISRGDWSNQRENDALTIEMYGWKDRATALRARLDEAERVLETYAGVEITGSLARDFLKGGSNAE